MKSLSLIDDTMVKIILINVLKIKIGAGEERAVNVIPPLLSLIS